MATRDLLIAAIAAMAGSTLTYLIVQTDLDAADAAKPSVHESAAPDQTAARSNCHDDNSILALIDNHTSAPPGTPTPAHKQDSGYEESRHGARESSAQKAGLGLQQESEFRERFAEFFGREHTGNPGNFNAKIENRFYLEEWNQQWATSRENSILDLFKTSESLVDIAPLQIACRSKNCQIVLSAVSQDQARQLSDKFMQVMTNSDIGMQDKMVSFFPDVSTGRLVFYLSDNGNTDLFQ